MKGKLISIFKSRVFDVPEGVHACEVVSMYEFRGKEDCTNSLKILFAPFKQKHRSKLSVVAKEYCIEEANEWLTQDLNTIFEDRLEDQINESGEFDYDRVIGLSVDVVVRGYRGGDHDRPYTFVTDIFPSGTLQASQPPPA